MILVIVVDELRAKWHWKDTREVATAGAALSQKVRLQCSFFFGHFYLE